MDMLERIPIRTQAQADTAVAIPFYCRLQRLQQQASSWSGVRHAAAAASVHGHRRDCRAHRCRNQPTTGHRCPWPWQVRGRRRDGGQEGARGKGCIGYGAMAGGKRRGQPLLPGLLCHHPVQGLAIVKHGEAICWAQGASLLPAASAWSAAAGTPSPTTPPNAAGTTAVPPARRPLASSPSPTCSPARPACSPPTAQLTADKA